MVLVGKTFLLLSIQLQKHNYDAVTDFHLLSLFNDKDELIPLFLRIEFISLYAEVGIFYGN